MALMVTDAGAVYVAPAVGLVIAAVGNWFEAVLTVTVTAAEVCTELPLSVARAVSE